jgi:NADH:ubiquinone oxidoreductase subunit C
MDAIKVIEAVKGKFSDALTSDPTEKEGQILFKLQSDKLRDVAVHLKHEFGFTYGNMAFGLDTKEVIEMSWYIGHPESNLTAILRCNASRDDPVLPSLKDLYIGFDWHEREAYDLLGIKFEGHGDLRRIYLPDNWEGHPLREDYIYKRPQYHKPEDEVEK